MPFTNQEQNYDYFHLHLEHFLGYIQYKGHEEMLENYAVSVKHDLLNPPPTHSSALRFCF